MSNLTKEELRSALISHGISDLPPQSAKKSELLALYEEHIEPVENGLDGFSSEEEIEINSSPSKRTSNASKVTKISQSSKASKSSLSSKSPKKGKINSSEEDSELDIDSLDDDELFRLLKENGVEVGPIVSSTRPFYKKKLALVLGGGDSHLNTSNGDYYSDTEPETEPEDEQPSATATKQEDVSDSPPKKSITRSKVQISPTKADLESPFNASGIRQRFTQDELDTGSSLTPTPRRSIHSYKVTETTRQVITRDRDGKETKDTHHTIERTENQGINSENMSSSSSPSKISSTLYLLLKMIFLLLIVFVVYVMLTTPDGGVTPVDQIVDAINSAQKVPNEGNDLGDRVKAPDASNVADV